MKKNIIIFLFIFILIGCATNAKESEYLTSSEDLLRSESEIHTIEYNLNSNTSDKILEKNKNFLEYNIEMEDVEVLDNSDLDLSFIDNVNKVYTLKEDNIDIRIRDVFFTRLSEDNEADDTITFVPDKLEGFKITGAVSDNDITFRSVEGHTFYGDRDNPESVIGKTLDTLIYQNYDNNNFSEGDIVFVNIKDFEVKPLKDGIKYQDGKIEDYFETEYVDKRTVIQYY